MEEVIRSYAEKTDVKISYTMPKGYETAFGTYDLCVNTLFLNRALLYSGSEWEFLFFFFHEIRHAMQYKALEDFPPEIRESLNYIVLYNGECCKLSNDRWLTCKLDGTEAYFTNVYLSLPYELDANAWAFQETLRYCPEKRQELTELYSTFLPTEKISPEVLTDIFSEIDRRTR